MAFNDVSPQAPVHFLVVPRKAITGLAAAEDGDEQVRGGGSIVSQNVRKMTGRGGERDALGVR